VIKRGFGDRNAERTEITVYTMMRSIRTQLIYGLAMLFVFGCFATARGQENNSKSRPKIGLALSGGGARGLAHIGVLEWFEEHRIPVDYIAGTSMGGLVGGLYAMGMSAAEIRAFVTALDWDQALSGPPGYAELSFRRKEDRRSYPTDLELGGRGGVRLPVGVNSGHYINQIFDRVTLPYFGIKNFDELPIPFACVATDMLAAEQVVIKRGLLTQALRATMSIPGVFTPVEIDGRVLADGGLLNNIPTDVVREMGADYIIAVNIGTPLGRREDLQTLAGMLVQVISVTTIQSDRRNLSLANLIIAPDLGKYTASDFMAGKPLIELGYRGASEVSGRLQELTISEDAWNDHLAARRSKKRVTIPTPTGLEVAGVEGQRAQEIKEALQSAVGRPIDSERLDKTLSEIRGGGRYASLGYDIAEIEQKDRLRIRVREKGYGPPLINPVIQVQSDDASDLNLSLGFRLTNFDLEALNTELRTDVFIGSNTLFGLEFFRPIGAKGFFAAPRAFYSSNRTGLYFQDRRAAEYLVRQGGGGLDLGYIFGRRSQLRFGYEISRISAKVDIGDSLLPNLSGTVSSFSARYVYDGQNSAIIPTRGVRLTADLSHFLRAPGVNYGFSQANSSISAFKSIRHGDVLFSFGGAGTSFDKNAAPIQQFTLGGPLRLSAFGRGEFRGNHYAYGGSGYLYRLGSLPVFTGKKIYAGGWLEGGSAFFNSNDARVAYDAAGAFILETPLGPMTLGGGWGPGGRTKVFFAFGRFF
jgi:NTE family protein